MKNSVIWTICVLLPGGLLSAALLWPMGLMAQQVFTVQIDRLPATHVEDPIYLTGNFNGWDPADDAMKLQQLADGKWGLTTVLKDVPGDRIEFKFTRGSWQSSECTADGRLVGPRLADLHRDTTVLCEIEGWRDDFPVSTASPNVHLLAEAFDMTPLDRQRKIWIYLPSDYSESTRRYPVIYMQDGQHLFDEATSQGRIGPIEWGVDETIDAANKQCIVVAINHRDDFRDREPEFYVHPNSQHPTVEGGEYLRFIVETLKPFIDTHYRTLPDAPHTALAGSSLGGLLTLYGGLRYPEVFGLLGVFSPSIWMDECNVERELNASHTRPPLSGNSGGQRYYFYAGKQENRRKEDGTFVRMHEDVERVMRLLGQHRGPAEVDYRVNPDGRHGALYWRTAFPDFYDWFTDRAFD